MTHTSRNLLLLLTSLASLAGCDHAEPETGACSMDAECRGGEQCRQGQCVPLGDDTSSDDVQPDGGAPETSTELQLCERIDECGYLNAGYSVEDCGDVISDCTADLLSSAQRDWASAVEGCLALENCMNFGSCYVQLDVCTAEGDAGETGSDPSATEDTDAACSDGIDNDGDGFLDCEDWDCDVSWVSVCGGAGTSTGDASCTDGERYCVGDDALDYCDAGVWYEFSCLDICLEAGYSTDAGCGYSSEQAADVCFCE